MINKKKKNIRMNKMNERLLILPPNFFYLFIFFLLQITLGDPFIITT